MSKEIAVAQVPVVEETQGPVVLSEVHLKVLDNGGIEIFVPETSQQLEPLQIENITRVVSDQLRDGRIAQAALEMFKQRLG